MEKSVIQIDDAGYGSLVGGIVIGGWDVSAQRFAYRSISVESFQSGKYETAPWRPEIAQALEDLLAEFGATPQTHQVEICRGNILGAARARLLELNYKWLATKITGPLQEQGERTFLKQVLALGVVTDYSTLTTKQGLYFHQCVKWLKGGNVESPTPDPERVKHCKTGWPSFPTWAYNPYSVAKNIKKAGTYGHD